MKHPDECDPDALAPDDSGVFSAGPMRRALALTSRWVTLEPRATLHPEAVRSLHESVVAVLRECVVRLSALDGSGPTDADAEEVNELLDASYVLERLEWCVLHRVPYIERPPVARVERWRRGA